MKRTQRRAFTLIEMLVAMALTLFVMVILSQAFVTALETFSQLKGIGDMQGNLRVASTLLQSDLAQDHFEGKRKLSDPSIVIEPTREGFFYVRLSKNSFSALLPEGTDADGLPSYRATADILYFTIKLRGNKRESFMSARLSALPASPLLTTGVNFFGQPLDANFQDQPQTFNSQWAEVVYYLARTGSTDEPLNQSSTLGTPLYALYRGQYLLVPNKDPANNNVNGTTDNGTIAAYLNVSCYQTPAPPVGTNRLSFNSPADVVTRSNRVIEKRGLPEPSAALVLSNVVSFHVRVLPSGFGFTDFLDYNTVPPANPMPSPPAPPNTPYPYKEWDTSNPPAPTSVRALQIIIRVWDPASQQTRQVTLIQDM